MKVSNNKKTKLAYLFLSFLKIGSTSFGGHMSLISVVQNQMVDKDKLISNETLLNGISLATILPGPFAVNVVTFIGYKLRGFLGALVSMIGVILPSFILVYLFSVAYFHFNKLPLMINLFKGILPGVCIVILSVALQMARKRLTDYWLIAMCIVSFIGLVFFSSIYTIIIFMASGCVLGYILYVDKTPIPNNKTKKGFFSSLLHVFPIQKTLIVIAIVILIVIAYYIFFTNNVIINNSLSLLSVFGGMSLSLFGGGYVFIPFIKEVVVGNMGWLTTQEFVDSIAIGQITPGPIMISAAFVGYKVQGLTGAFFATLGMFAPSGLLAIISSRLMLFFLESNTFKNVLKGVHSVAVGMICASVIFIGKDIELQWQSGVIIILALLMVFKFKWNAIYIIPASGLLGVILF